MFAIQYGFNLSDEDQLSIRGRVHEIGARFDNLPGLYQKAFLMADSVGGSRNRYTPFYLWNTLEGMTDFLLSESFGRVVKAWGRPAVSRWNPITYASGQAGAVKPRFALQQHIALPPEADVAGFCLAQRAEVEHLATLSDLHSAFLGVDAEHWQLMKISLWADEPPLQMDGDRYEVLYLSRQAGSQS